MRSSVFILVLATAVCCRLDAEIRFARADYFPDLGISLPLVEGGVAAPVNLPRAEGFQIEENGAFRLEDRFDTFDLWNALLVRGSWRDDAGNQFLLARLTAELPQDEVGTLRTRADFRSRLRALGPKSTTTRDEAVRALAPAEVTGEPQRLRRSGRRNFLELYQYPTTNESVFVYVFRPRSPEVKDVPDWYMAAFVAGPDEDLEAFETALTEQFLDGISVPAARSRPKPEPSLLDAVRGKPTETDYLAEDYRLAVVNYESWHFVRADDLLIVDDLESRFREPFLRALTNDLPRLRKEYAAAVPSKTFDAFHPAAIRVFAQREDYLAYVGADAKWTAAVWCPERREMVLHYSEEGVEQLLKTVWHEAFHQYLAYAGTMLSAAPWLNEGHAELFENSHYEAEGKLVFDRPRETLDFFHGNCERLAAFVPSVLEMDYDDFYAGTQDERVAKYRLAWSIAYFLQVVAPEVRFAPFASTRADYMDALVRTHERRTATRAALPEDKRKLLVAEWLKFWREQ